jgi:cytoskeletal protein CcmA (bactofilin family)
MSTICPGCNAAIELTDMRFLSPASRAVDIRGHLHIGPDGSLSSSWIVCGSALIEGLVVGVLRCEGEVHLATKRRCVCRITAAAAVIERDARVVLTLPLETDHLEVCGHLHGIIHCKGDVHVRRGGRLEAEVHARAVKVEKGGALLGACHVAGTEPEEIPRKVSSGFREIVQPVQLCPA